MRRVLLLAIVSSLVVAACTRGETAAGPCADTGTPVHVSEGKLTVGIDLTNPPFASRSPDGDVTGFEVELLRDAAQRVGLEVTFVDQALPGLVLGLKSGRFDVVASGLRRTDELAADSCLTDAHLGGSLAVLVDATQRPDLGSAEDLSGRTVAVHETSVAGGRVAETIPGAEARPLPAPGDPVDAIRRGDADAALTELPVALHAVREHEQLRIVDRVGPSLTYVFAVDRGNGALAAHIDEAIAVMRDDGSYDRLFAEWFSGEPSEPGAT